VKQPPRDRREFVIRFVCAAVFFGFLVALLGLPLIGTLGWAALAGWLAITTGIATFAAWYGDEAWHKIVGFLRWW
jgi:hypothetical protein